MKKQLLLGVLALTTIEAIAQPQPTVTDTVILGNGYANQIWYSLPNDEVGTQPKNNWDLAFCAKAGNNSDIMFNHSNGAMIWAYPKADKSGWSSVDTSGLSTWTGQYNSETEWFGALGRYYDVNDPFDLGWGKYDMGTHFINGDSIYIVKTQTNTYKKLIIDKLAGGTYTFTYANLDGSDSTTSTIVKSAYTTKKYGYFNLTTKTAVDREPSTANWDLTFGQYNTGDYAAMGMPGYTVTGILVNDTLEVAKAVVDPALRATYVAYSSLTFSDKINGLGYNWKTNSGVIKDSNVYFVRRNNGDIWKINFTGWISGMSGNGSVIFTKLKLSTTSIGNIATNNTTLAISPNPAVVGQNISIIYNFETNVNTASATVYDMTGRIVVSQQLETSKGLHTYTFNSRNLIAGTYIISINANGQATYQKFIVQ